MIINIVHARFGNMDSFWTYARRFEGLASGAASGAASGLGGGGGELITGGLVSNHERALPAQAGGRLPARAHNLRALGCRRSAALAPSRGTAPK